MPEQYCIGSTASKSGYNCINSVGSDNNYHRLYDILQVDGGLYDTVRKWEA